MLLVSFYFPSGFPKGFCMPIVNDGRDFCVNNGFHPVVSYLQATDFVENDCHMDQNNLWIITGPNMGGM